MEKKLCWWARGEGKGGEEGFSRGTGGGGGPDQQHQQEEVCVRCVCACDSGHDDDVKEQEEKGGQIRRNWEPCSGSSVWEWNQGFQERARERKQGARAKEEIREGTAKSVPTGKESTLE